MHFVMAFIQLDLTSIHLHSSIQPHYITLWILCCCWFFFFEEKKLYKFPSGAKSLQSINFSTNDRMVFAFFSMRKYKLHFFQPFCVQNTGSAKIQSVRQGKTIYSIFFVSFMVKKVGGIGPTRYIIIISFRFVGDDLFCSCLIENHQV